MFLNEYKNLGNFKNQYYYLKEYFYNLTLNKRAALIKEIKENFSKYLENTKINSIQDFNDFYTLLYDQYTFEYNFKNNLNDILKSKYVNTSTIFEILKYSNKKDILNNKTIQKRLLYIVTKDYQVGNFNIIEHYILPEYHYALFLMQIDFRIKKEVKPGLQNVLYEFIQSILNDPTYGKNKELHYINSGGYKNCLKMGDYVLQIGEGPHLNKFPFCSEIAAPILFKIFDNFQISLSNYLETPIIEEERDECYFKARDKGIILLDSKKLINFGKYKEDYIHPYKNISDKGKEFLGINIFDLNDVKKGTVKYLDVDFYISEDDNSRYAEQLEITFFHENKEQEYKYVLRKQQQKTSK